MPRRGALHLRLRQARGEQPAERQRIRVAQAAAAAHDEALGDVAAMEAVAMEAELVSAEEAALHLADAAGSALPVKLLQKWPPRQICGCTSAVA